MANGTGVISCESEAEIILVEQPCRRTHAVGRSGSALRVVESLVGSDCEAASCEPAAGRFFAPKTSDAAGIRNTATQLLADRRSAEFLDFDSKANSLASKLDLAAKRCIDIAGALIGMAFVAPIWAALWLKNVLDRSGPTLYVHKRVGLCGKEFDCYKFRTMVANADKMKDDLEEHNRHGDSRTFKLARDPRVTPIGRWLRKFSIDEFPQFLNVLKGDMSLVGPRPPIPREVALYSATDMQRLQVKPGLTCIWQVSGRSHLDFEQQLELDLQYIRRRNVWLDVKLVVLTIPAVVSCRGAW